MSLSTPALWEGGFEGDKKEPSAFHEVITPQLPGIPSAGVVVYADSSVIHGTAQNTVFNPASELSLEHLLGPPGSPHPVTTDDLLFEYNILKKKLMEESSVVRQMKDKNYFLMMKVKAKDDQVAGIKEVLRTKTRALQEKEDEQAAIIQERNVLAKKVAMMETHQMQLEYEKYKLQNTPVTTKKEEVDTTHVRGVEKAKMLLAHQLYKQQSDKKVDQLSKENSKVKKDLRRRLQTLETMCMAYEDEYNTDTLHSLMSTLRYGKFQQDREARAHVGRDLRFNDRVQFTAPDDDHIKALTDRSDYAHLISKVKEELGEPTKEIKLIADRSLQTLWLLFNEKSSRLSGGGLHTNAKPFRKIFDEFYKTIEQALIKSKQVVAEFARRCNAFAKALCAREKEVAEVIRTTRYSTCDKEVDVNIRPPTPQEIYDLRHEVSMYQKRLKVLNQETAERENALELRASKAESNLVYLQRNILALHRTLFNTLHLVYKHRFKWTARLPDPLRALRIPEAKDRQKAMEVGFNMKLGELLASDTRYMELFGNYMISEEYGANAVERRRRSEDTDNNESRLPKAPGSGAVGGNPSRSRRLAEIKPPSPTEKDLPPERKSSLPSFAQPIGNVKKRKEEVVGSLQPLRRADTCKTFATRSSV